MGGMFTLLKKKYWTCCDFLKKGVNLQREFWKSFKAKAFLVELRFYVVLLHLLMDAQFLLSKHGVCYFFSFPRHALILVQVLMIECLYFGPVAQLDRAADF